MRHASVLRSLAGIVTVARERNVTRAAAIGEPDPACGDPATQAAHRGVRRAAFHAQFQVSRIDQSGRGTCREDRTGVGGNALLHILRDEIDAVYFLGGVDAIARAEEEAAVARIHRQVLASFAYFVIAPPGWKARIRRKIRAGRAKLPSIGTPPVSVHHRLLERMLGQLQATEPPRPPREVFSRKPGLRGPRGGDCRPPCPARIEKAAPLTGFRTGRVATAGARLCLTAKPDMRSDWLVVTCAANP